MQFLFSVLVVPIVKVTANPTRVLLGDSVVLQCNVESRNPSKYSYIWRNSDGVLSTGMNSTWFIASVNASDIDTYTCEVENSVGQRGQDSIAIRFGSKYIDSHFIVDFDCHFIENTITVLKSSWQVNVVHLHSFAFYAMDMNAYFFKD